MEATKNNFTGLIIKQIDYKDTSKLIYCLTDEGIKSFIARGVRKSNSKLKGYLLTFNYCNFTLTDGKIPYLKDISVVNEYELLKNNINKYMYAGKLINIIYKGKYDNPAFYQLALKSIDFIAKSNEEYYYNLFLLKNLFYLGIGLNFSCNCINKGKLLGFNINDGVAVCSNCNKEYNIDASFLKTINELYLSKLENMIDVDLLKLNSFLKKYYEYHSEIKI